MRGLAAQIEKLSYMCETMAILLAQMFNTDVDQELRLAENGARRVD